MYPARSLACTRRPSPSGYVISQPLFNHFTRPLHPSLVPASLRHRHQLEHVAVRILKVDAAAAAPVVELAVVEAPRRAAVDQFRLLDSAENRVEFAIADVEGEM